MNSQRTALRDQDTITADVEPQAYEQGEVFRSGGKYTTWFGSESQSLFGTVHVPTGGRARGGVVLCPPLGKEQVDSYRGMALLAQKLCEQGLLVLRFDYLGTGDSHGGQDSPDAVARWQRSIDVAVEFVRGCGATDVALVGLRAGALLGASVAMRQGPLRAMVLWDPVVRGRSYLHEQRALYTVSVGKDAESDPRVSIVGAVLHDDVVADFAALDTTKLGPVGCPVLVASREERGTAKPIRTVVGTQNADEHTLSKHDLFLEPSDFEVVIPTEDIAHIASWLDARFDAVTSPVGVLVRRTAHFGSGENITVETMESLGPDGLFAIRATSAQSVSGGPTVVLYPTANEHRVGPVRMWVELARDIAPKGISVLRFDRRGTGESGVVVDDELTKLYSDEGNEDALTAVRSAGAASQDILLSGLCSGSWYSMYAARTIGVKSVVLLNTFDWTTKRLEFVKRASMHNDSTTMSSTALDRLHHVGVIVKNGLRTKMPYTAWRWLGRAGLIQVPEISLAELKAHDVETTVLLSPTDTDWFVENRGPESLKRLRKKSSRSNAELTVKSFTSGDHTLYARDLRETVKAHLVASTAKTFGVELPTPVPVAPVDWTPL